MGDKGDFSKQGQGRRIPKPFFFFFKIKSKFFFKQNLVHLPVKVQNTLNLLANDYQFVTNLVSKNPLSPGLTKEHL